MYMEKEMLGERDVEIDEEKKPSRAMTEAILKDLAKTNGRINRMDTNELIRTLRHYHLDISGTDDVKRRRLKTNYKKIKLASADLYVSNKLLPFYVILDFEATCEESNPDGYKHEIIEFPAVMVNSKTQEIEDTFQKFCKPLIKSKLSDFCTELTGITQEEVESADSFEQVLVAFESWLQKHELGTKYKYAIVTDGPWDMSRFMFTQCQISNISYPKWAKKWINLRKAFSNFYKCKRFSLQNMLDHVDMDFQGRPHCGLDDAKNIARILIRMMCDGANIQFNEKIDHQKNVKKFEKDAEKLKETAAESLMGNWGNDLSHRIKALKLEAPVAVIRNEEPLPTYEKVRRERGVVEAKIAKDISQEQNKFDENAAESDGDPSEWSTVQSKPKYRKSKKKHKN